MKVEFKRVRNEYSGEYLNNLKSGIYLVNDDDDIIVVSKDAVKRAISLKTLYCYHDNDWFSLVRPIKDGNQVIITGD